MRLHLVRVSRNIGYPLVMKVVGPVHKSDVGGVELGIDNDIDLMDHFQDDEDRRSHRGIVATHA